MYPSVQQIIDSIDDWAPESTALSYDNVGLQLGNPNEEVRKVLLALDLTPAVADEAIREDVDLIITHHPLFFKPVTSLTTSSVAGSIAIALAARGISVYSAHTNYDLVNGGVSFALAQTLGLNDVAFLSAAGEVVKLVTFVPESDFEQVRSSLAASGAGIIGKYDSCAFAGSGTGYFRAGAGASPYIGSTDGDLESVAEKRLEVRVEKAYLPSVLQALQSNHPYDEVAYDLYPLLGTSSTMGLGAVGTLRNTLSVEEFLQMTCSALSASHLRYSGDASDGIKTVAVCGGSGSDLIREAVSAGADAFVTADVKYHAYFEPQTADGGSNILLVDAGHFETEQPAMHELADKLRKTFESVEWSVSSDGGSPMAVFVP